MGKRALFAGVLVLVATAFGARDAQAQARMITGRVTSAQTGQAIARANLSVVGTPIVAVANDRGEYSLAAPTGPVRLLVRSIGFKRRQVPVAADQESADVTLDQDIFNLEAVVITGQATAVEQRNLPQAVSTVTAQQLARSPTTTIEGGLQGKIAGALIQSNSGAPGGGAQINLRGVSTINGSVDPVIVVDGLVISNAAIGNNINAVTAAAAGGNASNQDNPVNRIADLNPADIERVEILKGASAAAIYGGAASNGVVIITTRRGSTGAPRFHLTQRFGQFRVANLLRSRVFVDSADAATFTSGALAGQFCNLGPNNACPNFDNIGTLFSEQPLSSETGASIVGGTDQTRYFLSGLAKRDGGIAPHTGYDKQAIRANLDQVLGTRWSLAVSTQVIHSNAQRGISNNDNTGTSPYLVFPLTPSFVDLRPVNGVFPDNPFERSNPLQTYELFRNDEDVWRALGAGTLRWEAISGERQSVRFVATGGLDYFTQRNDILSPPELEFEPNDGQPGTIVLGKTSNLNLNLLLNVVHTYIPSTGAFQATTAVGLQYVDRDLNATNTVGRNVLRGQTNVDQATNINVTQDRQPQKDFGLFAQTEVLAMQQRLLLTAGIRADRSSRNGDPDKYYLYPKAAVSYRLVGIGRADVDEIKLRAAVGQTGNQPAFNHQYTANLTGVIGGFLGSLPGGFVGDSAIKPERQTEIEGGFDATLFNGRLNANVSVYDRTITDMLQLPTLAPSSGRTQRVFNGGKLRNRGVEIALGYSVAQSPELNWIIRSTFFANRAKILELPVPTFQTGGFGLALGTFQVEEGRSPTQMVGPEGAIGDANPDFQMSFSSDLDYKRWNLGMLWDWKKGGDVINLTELLFDLFGNAEDQAASQARTAVFGSQAAPWVQDASYVKLRELSLSYQIPPSATAQLFGSVVKGARITLSGRNLIRITDFRGIDPEVSNFGNQAIVRNIDVAPFPPSRSFFVSVDLDF
ncbi:MAG: SusC/RagA family TonB-linked outer membrane protein [Gemmatimonadales bacterium]